MTISMQLGWFGESAVDVGDSVRTDGMQRGGASVRTASPSINLVMDKFFKRKASSPCESEKKSSKLNISAVSDQSSNLNSSPCELEKNISAVSDQSNNLNSSVGSGRFFYSFEEMSDQDMDTDSTKLVTFRVLKRNGEPFEGALDRTSAMTIWEKGLNLPKTMIYGISLVAIPKKPFLIDYQLHDLIGLEEVPKQFKTLIGEVEFTGEILLPKARPPALGEEVDVTVKKTRFKISLEGVQQWLSLFGKVVKATAHLEAPDYSSIKCDDVVCKMILRKHIPGLLPAFGRKMMVNYPGQPIQCGRCFQTGHVRKECSNENIEWLQYAKVFLTENIATREMLGTWSDIIKSKTQD